MNLQIAQRFLESLLEVPPAERLRLLEVVNDAICKNCGGEQPEHGLCRCLVRGELSGAV